MATKKKSTPKKKAATKRTPTKKRKPTTIKKKTTVATEEIKNSRKSLSTKKKKNITLLTSEFSTVKNTSRLDISENTPKTAGSTQTKKLSALEELEMNGATTIVRRFDLIHMGELYLMFLMACLILLSIMYWAVALSSDPTVGAAITGAGEFISQKISLL